MPQAATVAEGQIFSVTVRAVIGESPVSVAEVHLRFDPAVLQVVALAPTPNAPLSLAQVPPAYDNAVGKVDFGTFALQPPFPSTPFDFLTIQFQALKASPSTRIEHELTGFPRSLLAFEGRYVLHAAAPIDIRVTCAAPPCYGQGPWPSLDALDAQAELTGSGFSLFPNPAKEKAFILLGRRAEKGKLSLLDIQGRNLTTLYLRPETRQYELDLHGFPAGTYLLRLDTEAETVSKTLIIAQD